MGGKKIGVADISVRVEGEWAYASFKVVMDGEVLDWATDDIYRKVGGKWFDIAEDWSEPGYNYEDLPQSNPTATRTPTSTPTETTRTISKVSWNTNTVSLEADDFYVVANGQKYYGNAGSVNVHSDPGDAHYTTLELTWYENGVEMRLFMYFQADEQYWWSDEIRTYNGQQQDDWIYYYGEFFKTRLGSAFMGDVELQSSPGNRYSGVIYFDNIVLSAFLSTDTMSKPSPTQTPHPFSSSKPMTLYTGEITYLTELEQPITRRFQRIETGNSARDRYSIPLINSQGQEFNLPRAGISRITFETIPYTTVQSWPNRFSRGSVPRIDVEVEFSNDTRSTYSMYATYWVYFYDQLESKTGLHYALIEEIIFY